MLDVERIRNALGRAPSTAVPEGRHAAVAIVLAGPPRAPSLCFVERAERAGDRWSGDVAFPGGWSSEGDATLRDTARRETFEEVGLALDDCHLVGDVAPMPISRDERDFGLIGASVFYVGAAEPRLVPEAREIADAFWVPSAHLFDRANRTVVHWSRRGPPVPRPAVSVGQRVIWGLTYRVLVRFTDLVLDGRSPLERDGA
jgi:8-oxo-dGTP pyrophosphatase MutT (NUDIX family)